MRSRKTSPCFFFDDFTFFRIVLNFSLVYDNISRQNFWKNFIHFNNVCNTIFTEKFIFYVNEFVLAKSNSFWLKELSPQFSEPPPENIIYQLERSTLTH